MHDFLLSIKDVDVYYGGIHAIHGASLFINEGEIVSIIGSNGAGKSTLMRTIAGEKKWNAGTILFDGIPLPNRSYAATKLGVSLVPEGRRIFANLTVSENLMVGSYLRKDKPQIKQDFEEVLALFPRLKERLSQRAGTLSGGEQQMLAVGRALMAHPKLLCLDEPSLGLAPIVIDELFEKIVYLNNSKGQTMLLVEQNAFLALGVANRGYVLKTGRIVMEGTSQELLSSPQIQENYLGIKQI
ncbi:MAG: ABC transporter ATP-binding protein [Syntrophomonadaceae bacterium]|jgi:branched-chain amino acid transport system ATP-binding protein|nr:ABC transporter ATP-binding protein [Syntrophomonadaceae bacterium]